MQIVPGEHLSSTKKPNDKQVLIFEKILEKDFCSTVAECMNDNSTICFIKL